MKIRSSAKALIIREGKLLVIQCHRGGKKYYTLPGGGQEPLESLEQTVIRECLEETGLSVCVKSLAAVQEEIITDPHSIQSSPDYCHEHMWYFRCELTEKQPQNPTHHDLGQTGIEWIPLEQVRKLPILPEWLREQAEPIFASKTTTFLGTIIHEKPVIPETETTI